MKQRKRPNNWPQGVKLSPILTHRELLTRARADLQRELDQVTRRAAAEGLPVDCYSDERQALGAKLSAVNAMIYYECGEYC